MTHKIRIKGIVCVKASDAYGDHDEVFMLCQSDGGAPIRVPPPPFTTVSLKTYEADNDPDGSYWNFDGEDWPELFVEFENEVNITLWDQDHKLDPNSADYLGNVELTNDSTPSPIYFSNGDSSEYKIAFAHWNDV